MTAPSKNRKTMMKRTIDRASIKFFNEHADMVVDMVNDLYDNYGVRPSSRTIMYKLKKLGLVTKGDTKKVEALVAHLKLKGRIRVHKMKDAKREMYGTATYEDKAEALNELIESFKLDAWEDQDNEVLVMCEAVGYLDVIAKIANKYRCDYIPSGGDFSIHWKIKVAQQAYTHIVYVGDMDAKGFEISDTISADIDEQRHKYGRENITVVRIAFDADVWGVELEGVDVDVVRNMVDEAIVNLIDMDKYNAVLEAEANIIVELEDHIQN